MNCIAIKNQCQNALGSLYEGNDYNFLKSDNLQCNPLINQASELSSKAYFFSEFLAKFFAKILSIYFL